MNGWYDCGNIPRFRYYLFRLNIVLRSFDVLQYPVKYMLTHFYNRLVFSGIPIAFSPHRR